MKPFPFGFGLTQLRPNPTRLPHPRPPLLPLFLLAYLSCQSCTSSGRFFLPHLPVFEIRANNLVRRIFINHLLNPSCCWSQFPYAPPLLLPSCAATSLLPLDAPPPAAISKRRTAPPRCPPLPALLLPRPAGAPRSQPRTAAAPVAGLVPSRPSMLPAARLSTVVRHWGQLPHLSRARVPLCPTRASRCRLAQACVAATEDVANFF